ncbi:MAG: amino acid ABC transporter substrate-binding protein [Clostridia bacterium]|nr:amino acid ABC transporter substrate-binding protein [Clostridia bacterium]
MKKIIALVLALLLIMIGCVACATPDDVADDTSETTTTPDNDNNDGDSKEKPVLKMATNAYFQPYEFYKDGKIVGIDAEIAAAIAEYMGYELEIVDMEFDSIITAVKEGSVDFGMAGMTVTEKRLLEIDFSNSYATGVQSIIVPANSPITSVDDLYADGANYKIGVQRGTTGDIYATDDFGSENVTTYDNGNGAVLALLGGDVDCVIIDNEPAKALVNANEGLAILDTSYADEDYAICIKKGNSALLEKINEAIVALTADGTIDEIVAKYIPAE